MVAKKKILYIITKGNWGGAQRYVYDLATSLPQDKFEAVVACGIGGLLIERLKDLNIRTIEIKSLQRDIKLKNEFRVLKELVKIIKEEKPDIVHLNSSKIGGLGSLAVWYFRTLHLFSSLTHNTYPLPRSIFTAHGWAFNEDRGALQKFLILASHWLTLVLNDATITVSEKAKKDVERLPFVKNKIKVVYNGISEFKTLSQSESRQKLADGEPKEKVVIFSLAELHKNKGLDIALRGLALLPQTAREKIIYSIAGSGEKKDELEKLSQELRLQNSVKFLGQVPEGRQLLSGADIFLLPSRTEAFPYALLEAGSARLPVIATSVGGIPEVIRDMQNGILVHRNNPKEIAEAILYLLEHKDKAKEFGNEIEKTIKNFFTIEKMLSETIKLYQN